MMRHGQVVMFKDIRQNPKDYELYGMCHRRPHKGRLRDGPLYFLGGGAIFTSRNMVQSKSSKKDGEKS